MEDNTRRGERIVASELDPSFGDGRERDVRPDVVGEERRGVNHECAGVCHVQVVAEDDTVRETSEGKALSGGKVCFLKTNNVVCFNEITKSTRNL